MKQQPRIATWLIRVTCTGVAVVTGVAAVVSYKHMRGLAIRVGEDHLVAAILPFSVDGLLAVAASYLLMLAFTGRKDGRVVAWFAVVMTIVASMAANWAHAQPRTDARLVSLWAPIALTMALELALRYARGVAMAQANTRDEPAHDAARDSAELAHGAVHEPLGEPVRDAAAEHVEAPSENDQSSTSDLRKQQDQAHPVGVSADAPAPASEPRPKRTRPRSDTGTRVPPAARPSTPTPRPTRSDDELVDALSAYPDDVIAGASLRTIAAELGIGTQRARRIRDQLQARRQPHLTVING